VSANEYEFSEVPIECEQDTLLVDGQREHIPINVGRIYLDNCLDIELLLSQ